MKSTGKDNRPPLRPVTKIELSEKNKKIRLILFFVFLAIALAAFTAAVISLISSGSGWTTIEVSTGDFATNCSGDFVFQYYLGDSGVSATAEHKLLIALYTEAATTAFRVFDTAPHDGVGNVAYVNANVNRTVEVDPLLYGALSQLEEYGNRTAFISPLYDYYYNLFTCDYDYQAQEFDPFTNPEVAAFFAEALEFIGNPDHISVSLLGDNKISLDVSEEYLAFAAANGIVNFLDFGWMKNAFIIDYFADVMTRNGYTKGNFSSYDGFVRNLDDRDIEYSLNLYDINDGSAFFAGKLTYRSGISLVYYRNFALNSLDYFRFYRYENGSIRSCYIDTADGLCKSALNSLVCYSKNTGCAGILLRSVNVYISDSLDESALEALAGSDIEYVRPDKLKRTE